MSYVQGCVIAVPNENKEVYKKLSSLSAEVFKEHGVLQFMECWGTNVPDGKNTSFLKAVQCKQDETVVFSWMIWPSKAACDAGMPKVMSDPRLSKHSMPFDGSRMIFGGFEVLTEA